MRRFGTQGPVHPSENYVVARAERINDFIKGDRRILRRF